VLSPQERDMSVIIQKAFRKVIKEAKLTTIGPSSSNADDSEMRKSSRRLSNLLENLTQQVISDLNFSVYKKDAFCKLWSIFQLEWNEDMFNATYRPKFSRTEFLKIFTRDLYNKLQLQAIAVGLDIFNDEIIDNSVQY
jgi:hypothetical protein